MPCSIVISTPRPPKRPFVCSCISEKFGVEEGGMRIKRGQHAGDGGFDQVAVVDLVDIALHALENVTEKPELP